MKKFTLTVIFICILALFSVPAFAFDSDNLNSLTVYNETGFDIWYLHVSPEDSEGWGADVLGSQRTLDDGEYLGFYILYPDECNSFDIMAIDEEGDSYFIWEYEICDGYEEELEITLDDWDDEFEIDLEEITIINDTGYDILYLFISPSDSDMWGIDHLDDETILSDGDSVEFLAPAGASFDVMLVDEDEDTYSKYNTELSGKLVIDISDYDD